MVTEGRVPGRALAALLFFAVCGIGFLGLTKLDVSTSITHFLPGAGDEALIEVSQSLAGSEIVRTIIVTVETSGPDASAQAVKALEEKLRDLKDVAWVRSGVDDTLQTAVKDLYLPRRYFFASDRPEQMDFSDAGLSKAAQELKHQLSLPTGALIRPLAPEDPFLFFFRQLRRLEGARVGDLSVHNGRFVTPDGTHGVLFLASKGSPFRGQTTLMTAMTQAFSELQAEYPDVVRIEQSGVHRFAASAERSIKADVTRISLVSTVGILALFFLVFRSFRYVLLAFVPVAAGVLAAIAASAFTVSSIHGITLAFGCSMVGVCIDYGVHLLNHHALAAGTSQPIDFIGPGMAWAFAGGIDHSGRFARVGVDHFSGDSRDRTVFGGWCADGAADHQAGIAGIHARGAPTDRTPNDVGSMVRSWFCGCFRQTPVDRVGVVTGDFGGGFRIPQAQLER